MDKPERVLITGATGFIGGAIARRWSVLGLGRLGEVRVRALVRDPHTNAAESLARAGVELAQGDLTSSASFDSALRECDLVLHAAAETGQNSLQAVWQKGVEATRSLYDAAAQAGVRRFVFISSLMVYGGANTQAGEDLHPQPFGDPYSDAKIAAEERLLDGAGQPGCPSLAILRLAPVYGPGSLRWTKEPIARAVGKRLAVPGSGDYPFPYLYVDNMVDAVTAAVTSQASGVYNIFDGVTTYRAFMRHYADMARTRLRSTPLRWMAGLAAVGELVAPLTGHYPQLNRCALRAMLNWGLPPASYPEKAIRELGWRPRISLAEGMALIENSNGFHPHPRSGRTADPWQQNDEWVEEEEQRG